MRPAGPGLGPIDRGAGPGARPTTETAGPGVAPLETERAGPRISPGAFADLNFSPERPTTESVVELQREVAEVCDIDRLETYFPVDGAELGPQSEERLQRVADCLNHDELRDREITLTGYADPRGPEEYNEQLGRSRAETVAEYLAEHGVERDRITIRSGGQVGTLRDQQGWPYARRVEIEVGDPEARAER